MPEHIQEQPNPTNGNQQQNQRPEQQPRQPIEVQPDGTWILGRGADRWMPTKNQIDDLRWVVERDLRKELGVPPKWAWDEEKIEFHKRQLALLDLAKQAPRCEHVFTDGRCCKAPRVKKGKLCYAHTLMEEKRPLELNLPPLEDANAVMLWLMDVLRGLAEGRTSEKTAGLMFYGLQLAMVNARFTTFKDTDHKEMVRKAPKLGTGAKPQRTRRSTKEEATGALTAKGAEVAKNEEQRAFTAEIAENAEEGERDAAAAARERRDRTASPASETNRLPLRPQRNSADEAAEDFTAEAQGDRRDRAASPSSEQKALPQRAQRNTEEDFTAGVAENAKEGSGKKGSMSRTGPGMEPQNAEVNPGVESAKSLFFGVEVGEGVADNRPVAAPSEPPRKGGQKEVLMVPEEVRHYAGR